MNQMNMKQMKKWINAICLLVVFSSFEAVHAESNAVPIKLDKKALASFAKSSKRTLKQTNTMVGSIQELNQLWGQYDSATSESEQIQLAGQLTDAIKKASRENTRWNDSLKAERERVADLVRSATPETLNITISQLSPEVSDLAKNLMDRYLDGLDPQQLRTSGIKNHMIAIREGWRNRRIRQGQFASTQGFFTKEDLMKKLASLDDNRVISDVLNDIYVEMTLTLDMDIQNGVVSGLRSGESQKALLGVAKGMLGATQRTSSQGAYSGQEDEDDFRFNPFAQ